MLHHLSIIIAGSIVAVGFVLGCIYLGDRLWHSRMERRASTPLELVAIAASRERREEWDFIRTLLNGDRGPTHIRGGFPAVRNATDRELAVIIACAKVGFAHVEYLARPRSKAGTKGKKGQGPRAQGPAEKTTPDSGLRTQ